jgi:hypothetical protein
MSGRKDDLNIKGAFLHMASDALVAFGVVIAGAVIMPRRLDRSASSPSRVRSFPFGTIGSRLCGA